VKPLVSVMMPAYNASSYISDAIRSMQAQTYEDWQLCVVDDGSDDNTALIAQTFANTDGRIVVEKIAHAGCPVARNTALEMATGDIIARLDADDTHNPLRLEAQVNRLLKTDADIVTCNMNWLKGKVLLQRPPSPMNARAYMVGKTNGPCCASIVAWSRVYSEVGGFDPKLLAGSDGDWNFRAILKDMTWSHYNKHWYNQRRHSTQLSQAMRSMQRKVHEDCRKKYYESFRNRSR